MAWGEKYLKNQFPYIEENRADIDDKEYQKLQVRFKHHYMRHKKTYNTVFE